MKKLLFFFIIFISSVMYSQQIDPSTQINWPNITGNGSPLSNNCTINSVGMMYTDKTNNIEYFCGINGWFSTSSSVNLTTTGTSGAATLSGNILNIPQYLGVSSLNSLSGEVNLTSTDSSVTITPSGSTINLQAAVGSSSVQYNPTSTAYILTGSSVMSDDNKNFSPAIPISSWSCNGTICTVTSTSAHGLVAGNWVDLGTMSNWFPIPINRGYEDTGIGSFQVLSTGLTSTSFEVSYTLNTGSCSSSCGSAYNANYWGVYTAAKEPYLNGHGTTYYAWTPIANLAANFSTVINCSLGNPTYLIIEGGQNDLYSSVPVSTIESDFQSIWAQAHAAGCIIIQGTILPTNYGATGGLASVWIGTGQLNTWLVQQSKTSTTITTGAYWDKFIDFTANELNASLGMLGSDAQGAAWFGERINEAVGTQGGSYPTMSMWGPANSNGYSIAFYPNDFVFYDRNWYQYAEFSSDGQYLSLTASDPYISVDPLLKQWWPNTLAGQSVCTQMGVNTSNNNGFSLCMKYAGDGSASNYFSIGAFGEATAANFFANGGVQFPEIAASSGSNCLQIDASGNITNTGAACGSGGVQSINGNSGAFTFTGSDVVCSTTTCTFNGLPTTGGTLTGPLVGTSASFSSVAAGTTNGAFDPTACGRSSAPSWCSGSDLGQWTAAAFAQCAEGTQASCDLELPPNQIYTYATTLTIPALATTGTINGGFPIFDCQGSTLVYTGSGDAVLVAPRFPEGTSGILRNCNIVVQNSVALPLHTQSIRGFVTENVTLGGTGSTPFCAIQENTLVNGSKEWTERNELALKFYGCTVGVKLQLNGGETSFLYNKWNLSCIVNADQTCFLADGALGTPGSELDIVANTYGTTGHQARVISATNGAQATFAKLIIRGESDSPDGTIDCATYTDPTSIISGAIGTSLGANFVQCNSGVSSQMEVVGNQNTGYTNLQGYTDNGTEFQPGYYNRGYPQMLNSKSDFLNGTGHSGDAQSITVGLANPSGYTTPNGYFEIYSRTTTSEFPEVNIPGTSGNPINSMLFADSYSGSIGIGSGWGWQSSSSTWNLPLAPLDISGNALLSGNLGIGTVAIPRLNLQINGAGGLQNPSDQTIDLVNNLYFDGVSWKYLSSGPGGLLQQYQGTLTYYTAPSGTAGTTATLTTVFTLSNTGTITAGPSGLNYVPLQSTGTQVAGQLACIKSVGPPIQLGTCSGTVNATTSACGTCN